MEEITIKAKKLILELQCNEDKYVTGQLDLDDTLNATENMYDEICSKTTDEMPTTMIYDSNLMKEQSRIAKQRSKYYKPDSLVFNPVEFSTNLKLYLGQLNSQNKKEDSKTDEMLWLKMGEFAKKFLYTTPSFNFLNGSFDPDPVEIVKKKRKMREKDKIGKETKPMTTGLNENTDNQEMMISEANRLLSVLYRLCKKSEENIICYFEFVTDPTSFTRTVENIFIVSLLVKEGCARLIKDGKGLPCLTFVEDKDRRSRKPMETKQGMISMSKEEWKDIIRTFKFKKPLIPPRKSIQQTNGGL